MTFGQVREYQVQVPLGNLPVHLVLVGNKARGRVAFVKVAPVGLILESVVAGKVGAMFTEDDFSLSSDDGNVEAFDYNKVYDYKEIPLMLRWLQQQRLQQPA